MKEPVPSQKGSKPASSDEGRRGEFGAHFARSFRVLWFIASGIVGNRTLAEDVVQEAAMIGMEKFDEFVPGTNFTAWMGQMVRHVALNSIRKEKRQRTHLAEAGAGGRLGVASSEVGRDESSRAADASLSWSARGELPPDQQHFDDHVIRALGEVSPAARACLLLRTVEGLEYGEISKLLGIPEGTAMSHVHRSRQQLRDRLRGQDPTGGRAPSADTTGDNA